MNEDQLDRIDRNIVAALSRDGRLSMAELAAKVDLSKTPVQARVRRLENAGFIRGYSAVIDRERMGEGHVAFVQVTLSDTRSAALDAFNRAVQGVPEIEQCHMMAASFDYLLKVRTKDIAAYRRILGERYSAKVFRNATSAARSRSDRPRGCSSDAPRGLAGAVL
jgi:Lrp/AsnC family leucine-responsive transcriptional regulator